MPDSTSEIRVNGTRLDDLYARTDWLQYVPEQYIKKSQGDPGSLWTWGLNNNGQLGVGDVTNRSSPVQVGSLTNWSTVAGGYLHTAALLE